MVSFNQEQAAAAAAIAAMSFCKQPEVFSQLVAWMKSTEGAGAAEDMSWMLQVGAFDSPAVLKEACDVLAITTVTRMAAADLVEALSRGR